MESTHDLDFVFWLPAKPVRVCVLRDTPPMVSPESARRVMETYLAADLSAESGEPVTLPLNNQALSAVQELCKKFRTPV
jgi:hypothetical protein